MRVVAYEHPAYGITYVTWSWEPAGRGQFAWVPVAAEFDMFVPQQEQEYLMWELQVYRVGLRPRNELDRERSMRLPGKSKSDPTPPEQEKGSRR